VTVTGQVSRPPLGRTQWPLTIRSRVDVPALPALPSTQRLGCRAGLVRARAAMVDAWPVGCRSIRHLFPMNLV
jgi:hypothetical protein